MSDKRNRSQLRAEHPDGFTEKLCIEEVRDLESGVLEVRPDTGEFFKVDPTGNEDLKLPEAGDEVTLYLGCNSPLKKQGVHTQSNVLTGA